MDETCEVFVGDGPCGDPAHYVVYPRMPDGRRLEHSPLWACGFHFDWALATGDLCE